MPHPKLFLVALSFYTRLPMPPSLDHRRLPEAILYLPLVGWLVGGISAFSFYLAQWLWPENTAIILALIVGILITGALHEDGFADVCDGFGGGWSKQRILEIMKDSHIGVYGALGLLLLMLLKFTALNSLSVSLLPASLLAGHSLSRLSPLLLMHSLNYARDEHSKATAAIYRPNRQQLAIAGSIALLPLLLLPPLYLLTIIPVLLSTALLGSYFYRHIGGYTGDCLGASQQVAEVIFYLSMSALWKFI
jgi:adenosylcobinamide-GDP ribazoletransferase